MIQKNKPSGWTVYILGESVPGTRQQRTVDNDTDTPCLCVVERRLQFLVATMRCALFAENHLTLASAHNHHHVTLTYAYDHHHVVSETLATSATGRVLHCTVLPPGQFNPLESRGIIIVPHQIIWSWYTLAVDGWAVTFGSARRAWVEP